MPISNAVRCLGPKWLDMIEDVRRRAEGIPEGGMTLLDFAVAHLDVAPTAFDEIARALARKGVIWIGKDRGVEKVYREKPAGLQRAMGDTARNALLSGIAPNVYEAARAALDVERNPQDVEAIARRKVANRRIISKCNKALQGGMSLKELRWSILVAFGSKLSATLYSDEPQLHVHSMAEELSAKPSKRERIKHKGITTKEKIYLQTKSRGMEGISRSDLLHYVKPLVSAAMLTELLDELEAEGMVVSIRMLAPNATRKAVRYFASTAGVPELDSAGRAILLA